MNVTGRATILLLGLLTACANGIGGKDSSSGLDASPGLDARSGRDAGSEFSVALTLTGDGVGAVTSSPTGIACPGTCDSLYPDATVVTLTATPDSGSTFEGWSGGACSGKDPCVVVVSAATAVTADFSCSGSETFDFTGTAQNFTVPSCVTSIAIDGLGAKGGNGDALGGLGGRAQGTVNVTGGEELIVMVGGSGVTAPAVGDAAGFRGGFNGGGDVFEATDFSEQFQGKSGTGGGASDVRQGGSGLANRILVAAGGGGGGGGPFDGSERLGGDGGGLIGESAPSSVDTQGGGGGTQSTGGVAFRCCGSTYPNENGSLGQGGAAYRDGSGSGGGGGGYYGGGGGSFAGGGGGSSYIKALSDSSTTLGVNDGDGSVTLSW